jgi:hypothetical protein
VKETSTTKSTPTIASFFLRRGMLSSSPWVSDSSIGTPKCQVVERDWSSLFEQLPVVHRPLEVQHQPCGAQTSAVPGPPDQDVTLLLLGLERALTPWARRRATV